MKETKDMTALEKLREGAAQIKEQLQAALEQRTAHPDPAIRARVVKLREDAEIAEAQLARAEADDAERQAAEAAEAEAAEKARRAAEREAVLTRQEQLAADVLAKAQDLAAAMSALVAHTEAVRGRHLGHTNAGNWYVRGLLERSGTVVANLWPVSPEFLGRRDIAGRPLEWPKAEREALSERLRAD